MTYCGQNAFQGRQALFFADETPDLGVLAVTRRHLVGCNTNIPDFGNFSHEAVRLALPLARCRARSQHLKRVYRRLPEKWLKTGPESGLDFSFRAPNSHDRFWP